MPKFSLSQNRLELLADVAEKYYVDNQNQAEIAASVGVTRSMVSRMLAEARAQGLVKIQIERPYKLNHEIGATLRQHLGVELALVVDVPNGQHLLPILGKIAARFLIDSLRPNQTVGVSWGTSISAVIDALRLPAPIPGLKVVQMLGAIGAQAKEYDGVAIIHRLGEILAAEKVYLNVPFLVETMDMARALLSNKSVAEALQLAQHADIALLGIGSAQLDFSAYYQAGYISREEQLGILARGTVGDVCGLFFDAQGQLSCDSIQDRTIGISNKQFHKIPIRVGVAGGPEKILPILGALRGGFVNVLVTDTNTAQAVLLAGKKSTP